MDNSKKNDEFFDKIKIFSSNDDKLKFLGEVLSNESSRNILLLLIQKEMTSLQICKETGLQLSLVIHHLNKMLSVDLVSISRLGKSEKNQEMKYYRARPALMILPQNAIDVAKKSKLFSNSIKKILKFAGIGISGIISWFISEIIFRPAILLERPSGGPLQPYEYLAIITALVVVICGLVVERFIRNRNN
ncbi:MAG: winged helix-turn-helix domain-containing protein [Nitrosopumilaceae archaeon]